MAIIESKCIQHIEQISKTKVRGIVALLKAGNIIITEKDGRSGPLSFAEGINTFREMRLKHDIFVESYIVQHHLIVPSSLKSKLIWQLDDHTTQKRIDTINGWMKNMRNFYTGYAAMIADNSSTVLTAKNLKVKPKKKRPSDNDEKDDESLTDDSRSIDQLAMSPTSSYWFEQGCQAWKDTLAKSKKFEKQADAGLSVNSDFDDGYGEGTTSSLLSSLKISVDKKEKKNSHREKAPSDLSSTSLSEAGKCCSCSKTACGILSEPKPIQYLSPICCVHTGQNLNATTEKPPAGVVKVSAPTKLIDAESKKNAVSTNALPIAPAIDFDMLINNSTKITPTPPPPVPIAPSMSIASLAKPFTAIAPTLPSEPMISSPSHEKIGKKMAMSPEIQVPSSPHREQFSMTSSAAPTVTTNASLIPNYAKPAPAGMPIQAHFKAIPSMSEKQPPRRRHSLPNVPTFPDPMMIHTNNSVSPSINSMPDMGFTKPSGNAVMGSQGGMNSSASMWDPCLNETYESNSTNVQRPFNHAQPPPPSPVTNNTPYSNSIDEFEFDAVHISASGLTTPILESQYYGSNSNNTNNGTNNMNKYSKPSGPSQQQQQPYSNHSSATLPAGIHNHHNKQQSMNQPMNHSNSHGYPYNAMKGSFPSSMNNKYNNNSNSSKDSNFAYSHFTSSFVHNDGGSMKNGQNMNRVPSYGNEDFTSLQEDYSPMPPPPSQSYRDPRSSYGKNNKPSYPPTYSNNHNNNTNLSSNDYSNNNNNHSNPYSNNFNNHNNNNNNNTRHPPMNHSHSPPPPPSQQQHHSFGPTSTTGLYPPTRTINRSMQATGEDDKSYPYSNGNHYNPSHNSHNLNNTSHSTYTNDRRMMPHQPPSNRTGTGPSSNVENSSSYYNPFPVPSSPSSTSQKVLVGYTNNTNINHPTNHHTSNHYQPNDSHNSYLESTPSDMHNELNILSFLDT